MPSTTRRDIASAYLASFTKLASWLTVSALVYRHLGPAPFALLALIRSTIGLLTYTSLGLAPSLIHHLAQIKGDTATYCPSLTSRQRAGIAPDFSLNKGDTAAYPSPNSLPLAYSTATLTSLFLSLVGTLLLILLSSHTSLWLRIPPDYTSAAPTLILTLGLGLLARLLSDPPSAHLQTHHHITTDNLLLSSSDLLWILLFSLHPTLPNAGASFLYANLFLLLSRYTLAHRLSNSRNATRRCASPKYFSLPLARSLLAYGFFITLAQLADYLYAPTDYLLINHLFPHPTAPLAA
ncbi:MAG TPA: hypothetical protein VFE58_13315, partial [Tepidisphaeraceae bacterium]|nr:hypothetical protein [Tepidisphaeraceae bacterium]